MWTGNKENSEYTGQITPYRGRVNAEIICKNKKAGMYESGDLWLTVMDKSFGSAFRRTPREKDWINAHAWMNKQFDLLDKYSTGIVTKVKAMSDIDNRKRHLNNEE